MARYTHTSAGHGRDVGPLLRQAEQAGCTVEYSGRGHWRITGKNGHTFYLPSSPGGCKFTAKFRSGMRRVTGGIR